MKIQLDTENKTITIEESVNLHDFFEQINSILPGGVWREYSLQVTKITEWRDPITVPHSPTNPDPWVNPWTTPNLPTIDPWTSPDTTGNPLYPQVWYTTDGGNPMMTTNAGQTVYNFEIE
jgi:hypothetical protein